MKDWNTFEKFGAIVAVLIVLGGIGFYAQKSIEGSSAFTMSPIGPKVRVMLDASSPLADLVIGGTRDRRESVWRFDFLDKEEVTKGSTIGLAGVVFTLNSDTPSVTKRAYLKDLNTGRVLSSAQIVRSGERWVFQFGINPPLMFKDGDVIKDMYKLELALDIGPVDEVLLPNDTKYNLTIDNPEDVLLVVSGFTELFPMTVEIDKNHQPPYNYVFKTKPTFTLNPLSPSGDLILSSNTELAVFDVTADAGGDVTFNSYLTPPCNHLLVDLEYFVKDFPSDEEVPISVIRKDTGEIFGNEAMIEFNPGVLDRQGINFGLCYTDDFEMWIPAGGKVPLSVRMDTREFEDSGDSLMVYLKNDYQYEGEVGWGIDGIGNYGHSAILFRGGIYGHKLIKSR